MKRIAAFLLLSVSLAAAQQGSWTLYYTQGDSVVNGDGSVTIQGPTVGISGNDGGWCSMTNNNYGWETPAVLLNGNRWQVENWYYESGEEIDFEYMFPNVTLPANGTLVDLSYAAKVQGTCWSMDDPGITPPFAIRDFFATSTPFIDGFSPSISPAPCWLTSESTPQCPPRFPSLWINIVPHPISNADLASQKVAQEDAATPHCGVLNISAPKQVQTCDGTTVYHGVIVVSTQQSQKITAISATSDVDNFLVLDLLGSPYQSNQCALPYFCMWQNYQAYGVSPRTATIKYNLSLTCSAPPDEITVPQAFACK